MLIGVIKMRLTGENRPKEELTDALLVRRTLSVRSRLGGKSNEQAIVSHADGR